MVANIQKIMNISIRDTAPEVRVAFSEILTRQAQNVRHHWVNVSLQDSRKFKIIYF